MAGSKSKLGKTFAWVLMSFVIIGLGGFGAVNFSSSDNAVASVGETEISSREYSRALSNELRKFSAQLGQEITFEQAQTFGITSNVLSQLITAKSLENEAKRIGISVNDKVIISNLNKTPAFQSIDGKFDKETYTFVLENAGMKPSVYESAVRAETSRMILQSGITKGVMIPENYLEVMAKYLFQTRDFELVSLTWNNLDQPEPEPSDKEIKEYHRENSAQYMRPETKMISYVILTPEMLSKGREIDNKLLEEVYSERISEFNQEEKRRSERLVFLTLKEAEEARGSINSENTSFTNLLDDRGLSTSEIDIGYKTKNELGEAGDGLFAAKISEVIGPFDTDLGPSLFRLVDIQEAKITSFEAVKEDLSNELALSEAVKEITTLSQQFDDLLASGASLEELALETPLEFKTIAYFPGAVDSEITQYEGFKNAATTVSTKDFPEIITLSDGSVLALRLDEILEPALKPLDEVYQSVLSNWVSSKKNELLRNQAELYLSNGNINSMKSDKFEGISRDDFSDETPPALLATVFEMNTGEYKIENFNDTIAIIRLVEIEDGISDKPEEAEILKSLEMQINSTLSQDLFRIMVSEIQKSRGIAVDESAINAVHVNFQ